MLTHKSLLEAYVYAKDRCCPSLIHDIYEPNAVLSISTSASAVAFPPLVVGAEGIAQTLVTDFSKRFTHCRTYYVCDELAVNNGRIEQLPWLVLMREEETASLRIGRGYYNWQLNQHPEEIWRASEMHIRIDHMMLMADVAGDLLQTLQSFLPYPWLPPRVLDSSFGFIGDSNEAFAFLKEFRSNKFELPRERLSA
ncbi:hypothetical protein F506_05545 [Herbaspirillum hiltneri N3]|uniref:SnoaL-like protein n=1 Tax=Herbaspirillum hiltneri N3 TaxID=1262470 RepID=A0ABM5UY31_9BURK|nr:hypothetical protein [Herbaspirillum hiltneri]AKZ62201.1 hypothetical protein F506_05545 [Herbaspirillum hiltneri N3]